MLNILLIVITLLVSQCEIFPLNCVLVLKESTHVGNAAGAGGSSVGGGNVSHGPFGVDHTVYYTLLVGAGVGTDNGYAVGVPAKVGVGRTCFIGTASQHIAVCTLGTGFYIGSTGSGGSGCYHRAVGADILDCNTGGVVISDAASVRGGELKAIVASFTYNLICGGGSATCFGGAVGGAGVLGSYTGGAVISNNASVRGGELKAIIASFTYNLIGGGVGFACFGGAVGGTGVFGVHTGGANEFLNPLLHDLHSATSAVVLGLPSAGIPLLQVYSVSTQVVPTSFKPAITRLTLCYIGVGVRFAVCRHTVATGVYGRHSNCNTR